MGKLPLKIVFARTTMSLAGLSLLLTTLVCDVRAAGKSVILATTTSTQDSGLLDVLVPIFERRTRSEERRVGKECRL